MKTKILTVVTSLVCGTCLLAQDQSATREDQKPGSQPQQSQPKSQQAASATQSKEASDQSATKVTMNELPQEVQKTMRSHAGNLNLENIQKISKEGQSCYQASFDKGNMKGRLTVGEDGSLLQSQLATDLAIVRQIPEVSSSDTSLSDLPEKVQQTIKQQAGMADVGGISKKSQGGKTYYHAAFNEAGVHTDLLVSEDGTLAGRSDQTALFIAPLRSSQSVALQSAPDKVQETVREHAGTSSISDIDKGQWQGQTAFKVMVDKDGMSRPLIISESGELLGESSSAVGAPASTETETQKESQKDPSSQSREQSDDK